MYMWQCLVVVERCGLSAAGVIQIDVTACKRAQILKVCIYGRCLRLLSVLHSDDILL